jgi:2-iminobutanoate/2-iminopropanoate deaminase
MTKIYGPYEPTRISNGLIFVSGQVGIEPQSGQASKTIEEQTHQTLTNLKTILGEVPLSKTIKTTVYLRDMNDFDVVNDIYLQYFDTTPRPARVCVAVSDLPHVAENPLLIEIDAVVESLSNK